MQALSGCMAAWELWEHALLPSLLAGAGTWIGDIRKAIDLCDKTQNFFWRLILEVPDSCIKVALRSETNSIGMKWRVWQAKVLLDVAIREQEEGCLAREVWEEQVRMGWPGLAREVKAICKEIGIADITDSQTRIDKDEIKEAIIINH